MKTRTLLGDEFYFLFFFKFINYFLLPSSFVLTSNFKHSTSLGRKEWVITVHICKKKYKDLMNSFVRTELGQERKLHTAV